MSAEVLNQLSHDPAGTSIGAWNHVKLHAWTVGIASYNSDPPLHLFRGYWCNKGFVIIIIIIIIRKGFY